MEALNGHAEFMKKIIELIQVGRVLRHAQDRVAKHAWSEVLGIAKAPGVKLFSGLSKIEPFTLQAEERQKACLFSFCLHFAKQATWTNFNVKVSEEERDIMVPGDL